MTALYNEKFNAVVTREYNGEYLRFPGMNPAIELKDHQKAAIAHTLYGGNTLFAHAVGAGKTYEMIASAMEAKRLGLSQKALMVVPKHLTEQTGAAFMKLYPKAKILVDCGAFQGKREEADRKNRQWDFDASILDAVVLTHAHYDHILGMAYPEALELGIPAHLHPADEVLYKQAKASMAQAIPMIVNTPEPLIRKRKRLPSGNHRQVQEILPDARFSFRFRK